MTQHKDVFLVLAVSDTCEDLVPIAVAHNKDDANDLAAEHARNALKNEVTLILPCEMVFDDQA